MGITTLFFILGTMDLKMDAVALRTEYNCF